MTNCNIKTLSFSPLNRKKITASFTGGSMTGNAGLLLLREVDKKLGLTKQLATVIKDNRHSSYVEHSVEHMLKQRIYAIAAGYEDINDHDTLNKDLCFQTAVGREEHLASSSTLSRFENSIDRQSLVDLSKVLVEQFIQSYPKPPQTLTLDFDPTDHALYGDQEHKHYHGYYRSHCFLPLHVFSGNQLLVSLLRPSHIDAAKYAAAILRLLVKRLRQAWPAVKILFRADCAFARKSIMHWCEHHDVEYIIGFTSNKRVQALGQPLVKQALQQYQSNQEKQRLFAQFTYQAGSWKTARRLIIKVEQQHKGANFRSIITNKKGGEPQELYDEGYCPRGDMENGIKQLKLDLHSDRNSCQRFFANHFRLLLSSCAYILLNHLKETHLSKTKFSKLYCGTLRLKLLKIAAVILKNTRRIQFLLESHYPYQKEFILATQSVVPT